MSSNDSSNNSSYSPPSPLSARRASIAPGSKLSDFFGRSPTSATPQAPPAYPGPITAAAANAQASQKRRMSISTLGLSGSPNQSSPFSGLRPRQDSSSSNGSGGSPANESAVDDTADAAGPPSTSPFGRRLSFGAKAMRDVRGGMNGSMNGDSGGFNWSDEMRSRAQRSSSIASPSTAGFPPNHHRSNTAQAAVAPPREMPKSTQTPPDHFQERILKGDFYMD